MIRKVLTVGLLSAGIAIGQTTPPAAAAPSMPARTPSKALAFDVVSIRQNTTPIAPRMGPPQFGPTPDGYRSTNVPLVLIVMSAYPPTSGGGEMITPDRITGLPDWA